MRKKGQKAELAIEYAVLLAIVVAALAGMQTYMKRGIQGAIKTSADRVLGLPSEDYLNAKTEEEFNTHQRPAIGMESQLLGAWERYSREDDFAQASSSSSDSSITVTEKPPLAGDPIRIMTINKDQTIQTSSSQGVLWEPAGVY